MKKAWLLLLLLCSSTALPGQAPEPPRLFFNCATRCYEEYLHTELSYFSMVRDRFQADVEILINSNENGSGGRSYELTFIGRGDFAGKGDTLRFATQPADSEDMIRSKLARYLRLGLVSYVAHTSLADSLDVSFPQRAPESTLIPSDPWNYFVFTLRLNGSMEGESNFRNLSFSGSTSARRITSGSRLIFNGWYEREQNSYTIDSVLYTAFNVAYGWHSKYVYSLSPHWSLGGLYRANHSAFANTQLYQRIAPAVEWNLFPYDQNQRRQFRFSYLLGYQHWQFIEETIYEKMRQGTAFQQLSAILDLTQPWGSVNAGLSASSFLGDLSRNRVSLEGDLSLRVAEGLQVSFFGQGSLIQDQISLARSQADVDDFLLGGRQLPTSVAYFGYVGISYTFGSINNSIVNPRLQNVD